MRRRFLGILLGGVLVSGILAVVQAPQAARAADARDFDPGYIISDQAFFDGDAMNATQIQQFFESKVSTCRSSYACLFNYRQNTPNMPATSLCNAYAARNNELASQIIARVGAACGISQKVLIVLLEKEQSLVTLSNPSRTRFERATGFGCPDTAPCDPAFGGFFYQVYNAARQFQNYAHNPGWWNYQAGRTNQILYSPNTACGSSPVFIRNQATANLYIYTPYQPNAAALANLYGVGDGCSSYGNRNFWRIYTDWFGSPIEASSLLRTTDNATVYLVSGNYKYPVPSLNLLSALAPLGNVRFVSQSTLNKYTTSHAVGRSLRAPDGTIYFFGSGIKLAYTSCAQAVDYGASCYTSGYVQLTAEQISRFVTGPPMLPITATVEGGRYYVKSGMRHEILDSQSQALAGLTSGYNVLTESALSYLPISDPIVRDSAYVLQRGSGSYSFLANAHRYPIAASDVAALAVTSHAPEVSALRASLASQAPRQHSPESSPRRGRAW